MVYKKYITKNGRVYGPYYYKSKRVGNKVISEYVGESKDQKITRKKTILVGISLLVVLSLILLLLVSSGIFTGKVVSDFRGENSIQNTVPFAGNPIDTNKLKFQAQNLDGVTQSIRNFKNWVIVTFKKGSEVGEYSYINTLSEAELETLIERDRALWLTKISS
ncbi:hypothetical protein GW931_03390 [archaeon]|nr:hypothetical protein [archaeon]PJC45243.1 MAG: hypothetical protein CO037_02485 [Candidatus Pacearchaeota archaeon CG_4_9_14_0_2_um_filter_30_8]